MNFVAQERPELDVNTRHTVACVNATFIADGSRVLINFRSADGKVSNPASFPVKSVLNEAGLAYLANLEAQNKEQNLDPPTLADVPDEPQYVAISGATGIEMLQDFMFRAGIPSLDIQPGNSVPLQGQEISGLYREVVNDRGVYHNWSLLGWRTPEQAAPAA